MIAIEARRVTIKAITDGYDIIIDTYLKKVKRAAHIGLYDIEEGILPWNKIEQKHIEWFIRRGYEVEVGSKTIIIRWGELK